MKSGIEAEVRQLIDGEPRPMQKAPTIVSRETKAPLPESARWHMRHKPYLRGGDAGGDEY